MIDISFWIVFVYEWREGCVDDDICVYCGNFIYVGGCGYVERCDFGDFFSIFFCFCVGEY